MESTYKMECTKTENKNNDLNEALKNYIVEPYFKDTKNTVAVAFSPTILSQQAGLCFKLSRNKRRFLYYKIMSKITFGKKHKKYKAKYKRLKWEIKEAKRILRCWGGC